MKHKEKIIKKIKELSGQYSEYEIFSDWVKALALSIANTTSLFQDKIWKDREAQYMAIVDKHGEKTMKGFCELSGMLTLELERDMSDVLGSVFMDGGLGSKTTGQFFTPFHLSYMCAQCTIPKGISPENPITLNEPSCGGGGMIIAAAKVLKDRGLNYQRCMDVVAQDLDWKGVYMTYVQLSLLGISAAVVQGDTLMEPYTAGYPKERVLYTPKKRGLIM